MGWLDRFRKGDGDPNAQELVPLAFEDQGDFAVARCAGRLALRSLERLRSEGAAEGFTAVLLGTEDDLHMLLEMRPDLGGTPASRLEQAADLDVEAWLEQRRRGDGECEEIEEGEWPDPPLPPHRIGAHCDVLSGEPLDEVCIARIPSSESWEAPCHVGMGGWNECPGPEVLAAFARRWHLRFGAEVVSTTHDVMEFSVATPPTTREEALGLAREQYLLCPDIVEQGCGSVAALASSLLGAGCWYFWWD
ncbi:MAG: DUF4253 domain-containing protein [Verrucomicrobia bacterium]|nr:DUF4253 domain-containing protein [Verrucomicrobiota bacterium]